MEVIDQFLHIHPHPLKYFEVTPKDFCNVYCKGCVKRLDKSSFIYGCSGCGYYLHKSCAGVKLPTKIQNFFHPCPLFLEPYLCTCDACFKEGFGGFGYCCRVCDFNMHVECAQRKPPTVKSDSEELIQHFAHWHPLKLLVDPSSNHLDDLCKICDNNLSSVSDSSAYGCQEGCDFFVHNSCIIGIPRRINHSLHQSCPLILLTTPIYKCSACDGRGSGLTFRCGKCCFEVHVKCALNVDSIRHFSHEHPLALCQGKEIAGKVRCRSCGEYCFDPYYGCYNRSCNFFLHKKCADELQPEIRHPFHSLHPLTLLPDSYYRCKACNENGSGLAYGCKECRFELDLKCALTVDAIQHFAHKHPLVLHERKELDREVRCSACGEYCFLDPCYICIKGSCDFILHKNCADELQPKIHHPFHSLHPLTLLHNSSYRCEACNEDGSGLAYCCKICKFHLDIKCSMTVDAIQHFAHKHSLVLYERKESDREVRCSACGEYCSLDPCYSCFKRSCDFFLHKKCADELQPEIHHPFHSPHPLTLLHDSSYWCKVCNEDGSSLAYGCRKCKFHLDFKCALFPTIHQFKDADEILHCSHKHPLVALHGNKEFDNEVRCRACARSCLAPCFGCTECNFFLHKTCAIEVKEKDIRHPFHPLHPLTLSSPPPLPSHGTFQCDACLGCDDRLVLRYHCADCDFDLHRDCVKHKHSVPNIKYEGHRHHLTFFDKTFFPVECSICHANAQTCFFRCLACEFNVHIYCIPSTPKTVEHHSHLHPLIVTESPFEYELISSEYADGSDDHEFYCDICEEKRCKFESVYYCAECKFIAEVRCVLSELLPPLIQSTLEASIVSRDENSEATIAKLGEKIAQSESKRKKLTEQVERYRKELRNLERDLEQENREFVNLTKDKFLYEYYLN